MIADRFVSSSMSVLDAGCGRGFFSFACARRTEQVVAMDLMDGGGRTGWWQEFWESASLLKVGTAVSGVRASATSLPFGDERFDLVTAVHAIRNFQRVDDVRRFFAEARRALKRGGRIVVVESDPEDETAQGYVSFYSLRVKVGWELKLPSFSKMAGWLRTLGFECVKLEAFDTNLRYAPVYLPFDQSIMKGMRREYNKASELMSKEEGRHPRVVVLTGEKR
jgi:ubiquinone/menaquinone biosynthesis C-methylase UbiE